MPEYPSHLDADGQPLNLAYNAQRRIDAGIDVLMGRIGGITADGEVTPKEADSLLAWTLRHPEIANDWPANILIRRLSRIYADGVVDDAEREELRELLIDILGENENPLATPVATLPLCRPVPAISFRGRIFVLTGKFALGPRRTCEAHVMDRGGSCASRPTKQTDYVVIGSVGSRDWIHSSWGRKIETAVQYRDAPNCGLHIVSEKSWSQSL